jgi:hypothetical protein
MVATRVLSCAGPLLPPAKTTTRTTATTRCKSAYDHPPTAPIRLNNSSYDSGARTVQIGGGEAQVHGRPSASDSGKLLPRTIPGRNTVRGTVYAFSRGAILFQASVSAAETRLAYRLRAPQLSLEHARRSAISQGSRPTSWPPVASRSASSIEPLRAPKQGLHNQHGRNQA